MKSQNCYYTPKKMSTSLEKIIPLCKVLKQAFSDENEKDEEIEGIDDIKVCFHSSNSVSLDKLESLKEPNPEISTKNQEILQALFKELSNVELYYLVRSHRNDDIIGETYPKGNEDLTKLVLTYNFMYKYDHVGLEWLTEFLIEKIISTPLDDVKNVSTALSHAYPSLIGEIKKYTSPNVQSFLTGAVSLDILRYPEDAVVGPVYNKHFKESSNDEYVNALSMSRLSPMATHLSYVRITGIKDVYVLLKKLTRLGKFEHIKYFSDQEFPIPFDLFEEACITNESKTFKLLFDLVFQSQGVHSQGKDDGKLKVPAKERYSLIEMCLKHDKPECLEVFIQVMEYDYSDFNSFMNAEIVKFASLQCFKYLESKSCRLEYGYDTTLWFTHVTNDNVKFLKYVVPKDGIYLNEPYESSFNEIKENLDVETIGYLIRESEIQPTKSELQRIKRYLLNYPELVDSFDKHVLPHLSGLCLSHLIYLFITDDKSIFTKDNKYKLEFCDLVLKHYNLECDLFVDAINFDRLDFCQRYYDEEKYGNRSKLLLESCKRRSKELIEFFCNDKNPITDYHLYLIKTVGSRFSMPDLDLIQEGKIPEYDEVSFEEALSMLDSSLVFFYLNERDVKLTKRHIQLAEESEFLQIEADSWDEEFKEEILYLIRERLDASSTNEDDNRNDE